MFVVDDRYSEVIARKKRHKYTRQLMVYKVVPLTIASGQI